MPAKPTPPFDPLIETPDQPKKYGPFLKMPSAPGVWAMAEQSDPDLNPNFNRQWKFGRNWFDHIPPGETLLEQFVDEMKHHPFHRAKEVANMQPDERAGWEDEKARRLAITRLKRKIQDQTRHDPTGCDFDPQTGRFESVALSALIGAPPPEASARRRRKDTYN